MLAEMSGQDIICICSAERRKNNESKVFALCVLSHGKKGSVFGSDGVEVTLEKLEELFDGHNCLQLVGRPKLFLIQACQGGLLFYMDCCFSVLDVHLYIYDAGMQQLLLRGFGHDFFAFYYHHHHHHFICS